MELITKEKIKVNVYPKDPQKVDKRGFYIRVYYGQKQQLDKQTKKSLYDKNGKPKMVSDKEEIYFSDYTFYPSPKNESERRQNKHVQEIVMQEAEKFRVTIRANKWKRGGLNSSKEYLMDYMISKWLPKKNYTKSTLQGFETLRKHFIGFLGRDILISQLDTKTCMDFYNYLQTCVSHNGNKLSESAYKKYMKSFKLYLEQAVFNGIIEDGNSPAKGITVGMANPKRTKVFLERHELDQLDQLDTHLKHLKIAYLFASHSAITKAELKVMKYGDFSYDKENNKWYVNVVRQKTGTPARLGLNDKAMSFILPMGKPHELVFNNKFFAYNDLQLKRMILDAGITKQPITFHTSKNNYSVMYFRHNKGAFLPKLMKQLQHKNISTTERYLKPMLGTEMAGGGDDNWK